MIQKMNFHSITSPVSVNGVKSVAVCSATLECGVILCGVTVQEGPSGLSVRKQSTPLFKTKDLRDEFEAAVIARYNELYVTA